jgi:hypothetical protein
MYDAIFQSLPRVMPVIGTHDWIVYLLPAKIVHRLNILGEPIMSNNISASFGATSRAVPVRSPKDPKPGFWRRVFNAWVKSYENRIDPEGNVFFEL